MSQNCVVLLIIITPYLVPGTLLLRTLGLFPCAWRMIRQTTEPHAQESDIQRKVHRTQRCDAMLMHLATSMSMPRQASILTDPLIIRRPVGRSCNHIARTLVFVLTLKWHCSPSSPHALPSPSSPYNQRRVLSFLYSRVWNLATVTKPAGTDSLPER